MTLIGIQRRYSQAGRIRLGERLTKGGKSYPAKLETFRLTSPSRDAIEAAAQRYGGTPEAWEDEWQVITQTNRLEVMLPPSGSATPGYSLRYELWSGGGCIRRCDGESATIARGDQLVDSACVCDPENRECKPTMRVGFFLPELPGFGIWRLDSTGYNAAAELPGMLDLLARLSADGQMIRAVLRLEQRTSKRGGQTRRYAVPVIELPYTLAQLTQDAAGALPMNGAAQIGLSEEVNNEHAEPVVDEEQEDRPVTPAVVSPAPQPNLDEPFSGEQLERWLAGTHAAMRERIPAGEEEHEALRALAQAVVGIGERSLNDLTAGEWSRLARAINGIPIAQPERAGPDGGVSDSGEAAPVETPGPEVTSAEKPADAPPVSEPSDAELRARYQWAEGHGWSDESLEAAAIAATGKSPLEMTHWEWQTYAATIASGPKVEPPSSDPPVPGTPEYKALPDGLARSKARQFWAQRERATSGA
jgi:hypothetical protein